MNLCYSVSINAPTHPSSPLPNLIEYFLQLSANKPRFFPDIHDIIKNSKSESIVDEKKTDANYDEQDQAMTA